MRRFAGLTFAAVAFGCAAAPRVVAPQVAPVAFATAAPRPTFLKLEPLPDRHLLPGLAPHVDPAHPDGAILTIRSPERPSDVIVIDELDVATLHNTRSVTIEDIGIFAAWARSSNRIYVLVERTPENEHRLIALDATSLAIVAESVTRDAVGAVVDHAVPPLIEPGTRGVRVVYRKPCAEDGGGCVMYETHGLADLKVLKTRHHGFDRAWSPTLPPIHVPDDHGEDDSLRTPESDWKLDPETHTELVSPDGRSVDCPVHGTLIGNGLWVGRRMFIVSAACCGGPAGAFLMCEVPE